MATISILVPVYRRPHRAAPLVQSVIEASTVDVEVVFVCTEGDTDEIEACRETGCRVEIIGPHAPGDYARKTNHGIRVTDAPFVFQGADDLRFTRGWDIECLSEAERGGMVGTIDLTNARTRGARHSTHSLFTREYAERGTIDDVSETLHTGYSHSFVDDEAVGTARARGEYRPSRAVVEHLHPLRGKAPRDEVYDLGQAGYAADSVLFQSRRVLWEPGLAGRRARVHGRRR